MKQLRQMHASDASNKALIFTQYNSTLDFVAKQLHENGFTCRCISGKMPMKQRAAAIEAFQSDPPTTVFVLSVRAAAVGITLTSANYIFMVEPLLNTALDDQAVGRAWRMGQKRPVTVKRLYIKGSVEEAIMQVAKDRQVCVQRQYSNCTLMLKRGVDGCVDGFHCRLSNGTVCTGFWLRPHNSKTEAKRWSSDS